MSVASLAVAFSSVFFRGAIVSCHDWGGLRWSGIVNSFCAEIQVVSAVGQR
jgi:hypothetical protein